MIKISLITACFNSVNTISDTIQSIKCQTYSNVEYVIVDGGSKDNTLAVISQYLDNNTILISEPDNGIYDALNKGIGLATGEVIGFLHADDVYAHRDVLANIVAAFEDPEISAVYGDLQYVRKDNLFHVVRHWKSSVFNEQSLERGWMPPHPTLYVRRDWYEKVGGFDTRYKIAADYFSILRLFSMPNFNAVYLPEVLVKMRLGGASNRSMRAIASKSFEDWDALKRNGFSAIKALKALGLKNFSKLSQFFVFNR